MERQGYDDETLARYLVGALPAPETEQLDELSVADDDIAQRLREVENDLVDAFVRGELREPRLSQFRSSYLASPARRERVEFAAVLHKAASHRKARYTATSSRWPWITAAAAAVLLICNVTLLLQMRRLLGERDLALAERAKLLEAQQVQQPQSKEPTIVAFHFGSQTRGITRMTTLVVPAAADYASFAVDLDSNEFPSYFAELKVLATREVVWGSPKPMLPSVSGTRIVAVTLSRKVLAVERYLLEISGVRSDGQRELLAAYPFEVKVE